MTKIAGKILYIICYAVIATGSITYCNTTYSHITYCRATLCNTAFCIIDISRWTTSFTVTVEYFSAVTTIANCGIIQFRLVTITFCGIPLVHNTYLINSFTLTYCDTTFYLHIYHISSRVCFVNPLVRNTSTIQAFSY